MSYLGCRQDGNWRTQSWDYLNSGLSVRHVMSLDEVPYLALLSNDDGRTWVVTSAHAEPTEPMSMEDAKDVLICTAKMIGALR